MRLSILDQTPRGTDQSIEDAWAASLARVALVEALGFHRLWFAEHHGHAAFAGDAPLVLAQAALEASSTLRVGTGGVLLAFHPPEDVATVVAGIDRLHPGRLDLGLGKAVAPRDLFDEALRRLLAHAPAAPVWLLGTGAASAAAASALGLGYAHGHFFDPTDVAGALAPRRGHRDSLLAVRVVVDEDPTVAETHAAAIAAWRTRREAGAREPLPVRGESPSVPPTLHARFERNRAAVVGGTAESVLARLRALAEEAGVDEVMLTLPEPDPHRHAAQLQALGRAGRTLRTDRPAEELADVRH